VVITTWVAIAKLFLGFASMNKAAMAEFPKSSLTYKNIGGGEFRQEKPAGVKPAGMLRGLVPSGLVPGRYHASRELIQREPHDAT